MRSSFLLEETIKCSKIVVLITNSDTLQMCEFDKKLLQNTKASIHWQAEPWAASAGFPCCTVLRGESRASDCPQKLGRGP